MVVLIFEDFQETGGYIFIQGLDKRVDKMALFREHKRRKTLITLIKANFLTTKVAC